MAKQGFGKQQHKVISSGRLISSARGPGGKKKLPGKRLTPVDPGYSLYSTDSEDQVTTIHKGLDRCAALLNGILQSERADVKLSSSKPERAATSKPKIVKAEIANKRHMKRIRSVSRTPARPAPVQKTVLSSRSYPGVKKENRFNTADTTQSASVPATRLSPMSTPVTDQHTHPQTGQQDSLPGPGLQNTTVFNGRLTTSTPTLSPERPTLSVYSQPEPTERVPPVQRSPGPDIQQVAHHRPQAPVPIQVPCGQLQLGTDAPRAVMGVVRQDAAVASGESSEYSGESEDDITPVRDTGCQTSFEKHGLHTATCDRSPEKTVRKAITVRSLLQELKAIVAERADCEALRLIAEVEQSVDLLPDMVGSTSVQAEVALAVQSLRSENAQLRRRLRIVNQQLMERERAEREARPTDCNFEIISLQSMNMSLQSQLKQAQKDNEELQRKSNVLQREIAQLRQAAEDKGRELQESRQQCELDIGRIRTDVDAALLEMKSCQFKLQASEQENSILTLRLQQKETEFQRLKELTRPVPGSHLSEVSELRLEKDTSNPSPHLSKAVLDLFEDEQVACPFDPVPGTINKYLKTLEVNRQEASEDGLSSVKPATWAAWQRGEPPQEKSHSPKDASVLAISNFHLRSGRSPDLESTSYVPLKESVKLQPTACKDHTNSGHGLNASLHDRLRLSRGEFPSTTCLGTTLEDFPVTLSSVTDRSCGANVAAANGRLLPREGGVKMDSGTVLDLDSTVTSCEMQSLASRWSTSSWSTFNTQDELDFKSGLAALDASIASLQKTIQADLRR